MVKLNKIAKFLFNHISISIGKIKYIAFKFKF